MARTKVDPRIGTDFPAGGGWMQTKNFNYRRESRGRLIVLFIDHRTGALQWGFGVDGCWSTSRFARWYEAEDAALAELKRILDFERGL